MVRFQPKTDEELKAERLLPDGEYSFMVTEAQEAVSKSGNNMIKLTHRVFKPDGTFVLVSDYLVLRDDLMYKVSNFCKSVGLKEQYDAGELNTDEIKYKEGVCYIVTQEGTGGYDDKNSVKKYIEDGKADIPKDSLTKTLESNGPALDSDEIPF